MPQISVIVPVYKVEKYIQRCVDSLLAQSFTDFELILVDDGSPDNCGAICDAYARKDPRIHVIHQKNGGLSAARNTGIDWAIAHSDSKWLSFVDSDDYVHTEMLQVLYDAVVQNGVEVSICGYKETAGEPLGSEYGDTSVWLVEEYYAKHNVNATVAWGKLYHKNCFASIRYPAGKVHEDEYVTYKILFAVKKIAVSRSKLYGYYMNPNGITKSRWHPGRMDLFDALEEQITFFESNGYRNLSKSRLHSYAGNVRGQIKLIRNDFTGKNRNKYINECRKRLRYLLDAYREIDHFGLIEYYEMYKDAYPLLVPVFWLLRSVRIGLGKLFRKVAGNKLADTIRDWLHSEK